MLYARRYLSVVGFETPVGRLLVEEVVRELGEKARKYKGNPAEGYQFQEYSSVLMWNDEEVVENQRNRTYGEFGPLQAKDIDWDKTLSTHQLRL